MSTRKKPAPKGRKPAPAKSRMQTSSKPKDAPKRRAKVQAPRRGLPEIEPHHVDLAGLALVVLAVFFACVVWLGWEGGQVGEGAVDGLQWLVGGVHVLVPAAFFAIGAILVLRPELPGVKPFRAGAICLFAGACLALAAGTFGLGPGGDAVHWTREWVSERGGLAGEGIFWLTSTALGTFGSHLVVVFLFAAALLLLTGASLAQVVRYTGESFTVTGRHMAHTVQQRRGRGATEELQSLEDSVEKATFEYTPFPSEPVESVDPEALPEPEDVEPFAEVADTPMPPVQTEADEPALAEDPPEDEEGVMRSTGTPGPATEPTAEQLTPQGRYRGDVTDHPDFVWHVPGAAFLKRSSAENSRPDTGAQEKTAASLIEALGHFGVQAQVIGMVSGPHITRYELRLAPGTKVGKVAQLKDDLAYALAASDIRILAPIPGKQAVGVEVPNARRRIVHLGDVYQPPPEDWSPLTVWLGKDVAGRAIGADLAKMPHLLVAGTTGAGKSGAINAMLSSILLRATPHEVRMVLVDPKQVELNHYEAIPHLLTPVITSPRKAATALQNLVREMEKRYGMMALAKTRSLPELNRRRESKGEAALPYILCVIDELADLMMVAPADVEDSIIRIAQKARAVGIHLVLATQSPRVDVITGMIKANVPSRIAFAVSSQTDSRVILDQNGAEALLGQGDMLFSPVGSSRLQRIQGAYIDETEVEELTEMWRRQGEPEFREELLEEVEAEETAAAEPEFDADEDPMLEEAIRLVAEMQTASTSMLQRRLRLGYTRAGRLIDMLERRGVISGYEGSKPRSVLISEGDVNRVIANLAEAGRIATAPVTVLDADPEPLELPEPPAE
jgi:S-DNA-T family DNA segregation ATPase FtsK/SpoIIIE